MTTHNHADERTSGEPQRLSKADFTGPTLLAASFSVFPQQLLREEARRSIECLEDVQLVIECILGDKWRTGADS